MQVLSPLTTATPPPGDNSELAATTAFVAANASPIIAPVFRPSIALQDVGQLNTQISTMTRGALVIAGTPAWTTVVTIPLSAGAGVATSMLMTFYDGTAASWRMANFEVRFVARRLTLGGAVVPPGYPSNTWGDYSGKAIQVVASGNNVLIQVRCGGGATGTAIVDLTSLAVTP